MFQVAQPDTPPWESGRIEVTSISRSPSPEIPAFDGLGGLSFKRRNFATLKYRSQSGSKDWDNVEQLIQINWSPCRFGDGAQHAIERKANGVEANTIGPRKRHLPALWHGCDAVENELGHVLVALLGQLDDRGDDFPHVLAVVAEKPLDKNRALVAASDRTAAISAARFDCWQVVYECVIVHRRICLSVRSLRNPCATRVCLARRGLWCGGKSRLAVQDDAHLADLPCARSTAGLSFRGLPMGAEVGGSSTSIGRPRR
jgi:hypothetical protein